MVEQDPAGTETSSECRGSGGEAGALKHCADACASQKGRCKAVKSETLGFFNERSSPVPV